jgi:uncharacterized RDD family membrane protein YckC/Tfp pilus assembly major pilin PilA
VAAFLIDSLVLFIPTMLVIWIPFLGVLMFWIGRWLYFALMESGEQQATLGKRAMGIKVTDEYGRRVSFGQATGRYFGGFLSSLILDIGYMLAGWTERKQALHDLMAGTFVVFDAVQPGQPLPTQRPPMPWYGWVVILLPFLGVPVIGILAAIALPAYNDYTLRAKVAEAIVSAAPIQTDIASRGCQPGERHSSVGQIETVEIDQAASGVCTITLIFAETVAAPKALRGETIELTSGRDGQWRCSSSLSRNYLPVSCRT